MRSADNYRFVSLIMAVVNSEPFQYNTKGVDLRRRNARGPIGIRNKETMFLTKK